MANVYFGKKIYKPFILSLSLHACHKKTSFNPFFSYFTLAGNSEERLTDVIYKLKMAFVTCIIELDLWTSNRSNLCFDFAVLQMHVGPVLKRLMADFLEIEQILHHVRNLLFTVYLDTTLLKGKSIRAF